MNRFLQFIGLIVLVTIGIYSCIWIHDNFARIVEPTLMVLGVLFLVFILIRVYYGRDWIMKSSKQLFIGADLIKATENFLNELPKPKKEVTANFIGHLVYRFTRLGIIGMAIAAIPIWLLFSQNKLILNQNEIIKTQSEFIANQNKRIDQQTYLLDSELKKPLKEEVIELKKLIDSDFKEDQILSNQMIKEISSTLFSFKPYRYLDEDELTTSSYSPEKSTILVHLLTLGLSNDDWIKIKEFVNFDRLHISNTNLGGGINFIGTSLQGCNFDDSTLQGCNFDGVQLKSSSFIEANLDLSSFKKCFAPNCNFYDAYLSDTNFTGSVLNHSDFREANLYRAVLDSVSIEGCDFRDVKIDSETSFIGARVNQVIAYEYQRGSFKLSGMTDEQLNSMRWKEKETKTISK